MLYLKKYIKYRKETGNILVCDCSSITNYELPLKYYALLNKLKKGYDPTHPLGIRDEKTVILDLKKLGLLAETKDSNEGFHESNWVKMGYSESEFYS